MEKYNIQVDYDEESDFLRMYKNKDKKTKVSMEIGDLIIDFGFDGKVTGIEFSNAKKFFSAVNLLGKGKLSGKFYITYNKNSLEIKYVLFIHGRPPFSERILTHYNKESILAN